MASTTTNGVVLETPYAIIRNIRNQRPWTISVVGRDTRSAMYTQKTLRAFPATVAQETNGIFVYRGDVITLTLQAPCNATDAALFDLYSVNPSTGAETLVTQVGLNAVWQKQAVVTISDINATTGALTYTVAQS